MATKINLRLLRSGAMPPAPPATPIPTDPLEGRIVHPADTSQVYTISTPRGSEDVRMQLSADLARSVQVSTPELLSGLREWYRSIPIQAPAHQDPTPADTADSDFDEATRLAWDVANAYDRAQRLTITDEYLLSRPSSSDTSSTATEGHVTCARSTPSRCPPSA